MLDVGRNYSCAVPAEASVHCWGYGANGQLGYGDTASVGADRTPASAGPVDLGAGRTAQAISAGNYHSCALLTDGAVECWGFGGNGRLGYGNTSKVGDGSPDLSVASAGPVDLGGHTAVAITAGGAHTCALRDDGDALCWGYGFDGQLGYGNASNVGDGGITFTGAAPNQSVASAGPVDLGAGHIAKAISAGSLHTCAILDDRTVRCWGFGGNGQLGYGNARNVGDGCGPPPANASTPPPCPSPDPSAPAPDPSVASVGPVDLGAGDTATAISAGGVHTCAIRDDGSVVCWGYGGDGRLGYGNSSSVGDGPPDPSVGSVGPVGLGGHTAKAISAGENHTCAILDDGTVRCWGYGAGGQLGYGNTSNVGDGPPDPSVASVGPVDLGGHTAVAISAGTSHTCALLDNGTVRCWGLGAYGQLGYCNTSTVGDMPSVTPGTAGPVNLVVGDGGALCLPPTPVSLGAPAISGHAVQGQTLTEANGTWSPIATVYAYQWQRCDSAGARCGAISGASAQSYTLGASDVGSTIRVQETASNDSGVSVPAVSSQTAVVALSTTPVSDATRARGFRRCLAAVAARAKHVRALTHGRSRRARARARRPLARQLASGRRRCVRIYGRTPGPITGLQAVTHGTTKIELDFAAPGTDRSSPPPVTSYQVKQSLQPIASEHDFRTAKALCAGACRFPVTQIGTRISLTVTRLRSHATYYYAVAALDNVSARPGPRSQTVHARTK
jgi:alpha-tubulin suppressor-like RCC1 family protein